MITRYCALSVCQACNYCKSGILHKDSGRCSCYPHLQRKKLTYIELKYLFHGQHVAGSCLGPKTSGFRVHTVSHSLYCFSRMWDSVREKKSALCCAAELCTCKVKMPPSCSVSIYTRHTQKCIFTACFSGRFHWAKSDLEWRVLKGLLEKLLLICTPARNLFSQNVCILHISSPSILYCDVKFCQ